MAVTHIGVEFSELSQLMLLTDGPALVIREEFREFREFREFGAGTPHGHQATIEVGAGEPEHPAFQHRTKEPVELCDRRTSALTGEGFDIPAGRSASWPMAGGRASLEIGGGQGRGRTADLPLFKLRWF